MVNDRFGVGAGIGVAAVDGGQQYLDSGALQLCLVDAALELLALEHVADNAGEHLQELELAIAQVRLGFMAGRAQHPVEPPVGELQRDRDERSHVSLGGDA